MLSSDWIRSLPPPIPVPPGAQWSVGCLHAVVVVAVLRSNPRAGRAWHIEMECSEAKNDAAFHFSVFKWTEEMCHSIASCSFI